jgi:glycosyltransferase involved in cell wall biosynthesis
VESRGGGVAASGHQVTAYKNRFDREEMLVERMREAGCRLIELGRLPLLPRILYSLIARLTYPLTFGYQTILLYLNLGLRRRPDLVVVSQGGNHDGWLFATACVRRGFPFVLISQKATDQYWPTDHWREHMGTAYARAKHCFFVSQHNLRLTEEQFGIRLTNASVVRNPFKVSWEPRRDWPGTDLGFRFACVGRFYPQEKGQDLLIRVLAREKWRSRPASVTFFGSGQHGVGLAEMADFHGLENVRFGGFTHDIEEIWASHHALVLPSRAEGLPLVLVEAMLSGRVAIVTDVAGNGEVLEDDVSGFLASAPTEDAFDEAMERAWQRRAEWRDIGERAAADIRRLVPPDPAGALAMQLIQLADGQSCDPTAAAAPGAETRMAGQTAAS